MPPAPGSSCIGNCLLLQAHLVLEKTGVQHKLMPVGSRYVIQAEHQPQMRCPAFRHAIHLIAVGEDHSCVGSCSIPAVGERMDDMFGPCAVAVGRKLKNCSVRATDSCPGCLTVNVNRK